jgi:methyltransferase (TIGR00027 family)
MTVDNSMIQDNISIMKKRRVGSLTAEGVALMRAGESKKPADERICYDPLANMFIRPELIAKLLSLPEEELEKQRAEVEQVLPGHRNSILTRVRYFDDYIQGKIADGMSQFVIIGAGYDSRPYRLEGIEEVKVFEIDLKETQAIKKSIIQKAFSKLPSHVSYLPLDISVGDLFSSLVKSLFDGSKPVLFVMEGLLCYLPPEIVLRLLRNIVQNAAPGSVILFDTIPQSLINGTNPSPVAERLRQHVMNMGEPFLFGIRDGEEEQYLTDLGFSNARAVIDREYMSRLFSGKTPEKKTTGLMVFCSAEVPYERSGS